ncbi:MAG TPA: cytochrome c-type biogenesis protein CcmH, partial [Casimicrobium sp.]|nr:cytochrome c-type biogenesis protein CcmH [Casimicrobium sp.]
MRASNLIGIDPIARALSLAAALFTATLVFAQTPAPTDAALEARVKALTSELRCLVCQNQTVADSTSPVANDLR